MAESRSLSRLIIRFRSERRYEVGGAVVQIFGCIVLGIGSAYLLYVPQEEAWWARGVPFIIPTLLCGAFFGVQKRIRSARNPRINGEVGDAWFFQPRPMWILTAKAIFSIVVALQLTHPVLSFFFSSRHVAPLLRQMGDHCLPMSLCKASLPFSGSVQEDFWLASLLVFIVLFHFVEYEWIMRAFVRSREGQAFGAGGLAPWDEVESETRPEANPRVHRSLAELTLPWETYKFWLPVLPIAVNLGFDRLDHRR